MRNIIRNISLFIITLTSAFAFSLRANADACIEKYGIYNSNECRIGQRGPIVVAGNGFKYRQLSYATYNYRQEVSRPLYRSIGVTATFLGSTGNYIFPSYKDGYSSLFCLDAQYDGKAGVNAERFLLDSSDAKIVQIYDAAMMSVMLDGGIHTSGRGNSTYWSKLMALRALSYTFKFYSTVNMNYSYRGSLYAGLTVAHNWNNVYTKELAELNAVLSQLGQSTVGRVPYYSSSRYTGAPVSAAAGYYQRALVAATKYAKTLGSQPKVGVQNPVASEVEVIDKTVITDTIDRNETNNEQNNGSHGQIDNEKPETPTMQDVFVQKDVVHTLSLSGFTKQHKFIINSNNGGIKFADGTRYDGLTAYISQIEISGTVLSKDQIPYDQDLVALGYIPENQNVEIKITVHFEGWKASSDPNVTILKCGQTPIKYSINGTYDTGVDSQFGDYIGTIWYSGRAQKQRYLGVEKVTEKRDGYGSSWNSPYETYLIDACDCDDLEKACKDSNDINSEECIELKESNCGLCSLYDIYCQYGDEASCEKYAAQCDMKCDTYFETFECCDEQGELIVSTLDDHEVSILGPGEDNPDAPSVKACFVTLVDNMAKVSEGSNEKNNSGVEGVKDQKDNTYTLADMKANSYCTVSCKEDYIMTMPTAKLVNAGRYFTFKAKVEGTKACYTNTIDREKYNKDIIERQEDMINKYNEYRKWYYLYHGKIEAVSGSYVSSCSCSGNGCGPSCSSTEYYPQWKATGTVPDWTDVVTKPAETGVVTIRQHSQAVEDTNEYQKPTGESQASCPGGSWTVGPDANGNYYSGSCSGGTSTYYTGVDTVCDQACYREILKGRMEAAQAALISSQEAYKRVLKEYDECSNWKSEINYDPNVYYDYSEDDYMNMLKNHIGEMDKEISEVSNSEWYCNSRVTPGSGNESKGQLSDQNYEQCNNSSNGHSTTPLNYIYCDPNGTCKITPENVSDARYKKVTSGLTANYRPSTLFYNVYPTGEITVNKADDNVALEHKLPVALDRERGIYKYTVNIENLGEFYDQAPKDNLGRYVGSNTAIVDPNTLEYNCSYLVNITKTTGWVCDFDDDCEDDCIANCIGPNCDDYCDGTDCVADCIGLGCIYDSGAGSSLIERLVSLNNLFPNGTDSYNWDEKRNDKARMTITSIEEKGNSIYNETPILSITLSPSDAKEIKKYNQDVLNDGGYSNKTVSCEKRGDYEEIVCYSSFIDDLLAGVFGNVVNDNSLIAEDNYRHGDSEYFELWGNAISEEDMIGPAWK